MNSRFFVALSLSFLATSVSAQEVRPAPEPPSGVASKSLVVANRQLVVAAEPAAAEAGREILRKGGSAVDAAIATELVLGLVEPQSSGLGGGAFLVLWDAKTRAVKTFDGRETAPAAAKPDRFLQGGKPMTFRDAVHSGLSVGVPGVVRMLRAAHDRSGKLPWAALFEPAIKLAEDGFAVSPRLSALLHEARPEDFAPAARAYFFDQNGSPRPAGTLLKNPEYATTLRTLAEKGAAAFYEGAIADAIVEAGRAAPIVQSDMTLADIAAYVAKERDPVCVTYRSRDVCGMGPPSSGGIAIGATLKLIEPFPQVQGAKARMTPPALPG